MRYNCAPDLLELSGGGPNFSVPESSERGRVRYTVVQHTPFHLVSFLAYPKIPQKVHPSHNSQRRSILIRKRKKKCVKKTYLSYLRKPYNLQIFSGEKGDLFFYHIVWGKKKIRKLLCFLLYQKTHLFLLFYRRVPPITTPPLPISRDDFQEGLVDKQQARLASPQ